MAKVIDESSMIPWELGREGSEFMAKLLYLVLIKVMFIGCLLYLVRHSLVIRE